MALLGTYIQEICIILCLERLRTSFPSMYFMKYNMKNLINENDSLKLFRIKTPKLTLPKVFPVPVKEKET